MEKECNCVACRMERDGTLRKEKLEEILQALAKAQTDALDKAGATSGECVIALGKSYVSFLEVCMDSGGDIKELAQAVLPSVVYDLMKMSSFGEIMGDLSDMVQGRVERPRREEAN